MGERELQTELEVQTYEGSRHVTFMSSGDLAPQLTCTPVALLAKLVQQSSPHDRGGAIEPRVAKFLLSKKVQIFM